MKEKKTWEEVIQELADEFNIPVLVNTGGRTDLYLPRRRETKQ